MRQYKAGGERMDYERGLTELYKLLRGDAALELEYRNYEAQLRQNLRNEQLFGPNDQNKSDRARIIYELNRLAAQKGTSFNDLCRPVTSSNFQSPNAGSGTGAQGQPASGQSAFSKRTKAYIIFHLRDKAYLDDLHTHLDSLVRKGVIDYWDQTKIKPGANWRVEIDNALRSTRVAIVLVSADLLAAESTDPIISRELPTLLSAAQRQEIELLTVIVRPCTLEFSDLEPFQPVNPKSLSELSPNEREKVWIQVARNIRDILK
jgi:hypothetical protein